jgi:triphosphoribosyl-dephospho-CoA synthase
MPAAAAAVAGLTCPAGSRGWCAAVAGILEATAAKPGNVHPAASFADLTHADLVAAAVAIAPVLERATTAPLGRTILEAVSAARSAADTNASLGIILLTAPLAAVPDGEPLSAAAVDQVLARLDAGDAADVYRAIALARPGGMGRVDRDDVAGPPPTDLRAAMRAAADRDQIARLWAEGFGPLFAGAVADLSTTVDAGMPLLDAIVECHLRQLAREPDSLIVRKHGAAAAAKVSAAAAAILRLSATERPAATAAFDASLRSPLRLNPGTTADIVAAALYILLRTGRIAPSPAVVPQATPHTP